jgi:hypothetical protein
MASAIDDTKPVTGTPTTQSVRDNFAAAKSEITALQAAVPTWTVGSVPFATSTTALGQDNAGLFYDNTNDRLGIGTAGPVTRLDVQTAANKHLGIRQASDLSGPATGVMLEAFNDGAAALIPLQLEATAIILSLNGGKVGINKQVPNYFLHMAGQAAAGLTVSQIASGPNGADSTTVLVSFADFGSAVQIGAITRNGTNTVAYGTSSDERLKSDIGDSNRGLDALLAIKVSDYKMGETSQQGLLAQQVAEHYPEAVHEGGEDANLEPWMIDYGRLTPLLIKAVQDLAAQVDDLKAQLEATKPA